MITPLKAYIMMLALIGGGINPDQFLFQDGSKFLFQDGTEFLFN